MIARALKGKLLVFGVFFIGIITGIITGKEPAVMLVFCSFFFQIPIAQEQTWIGIRHADHAFLTN